MYGRRKAGSSQAGRTDSNENRAQMQSRYGGMNNTQADRQTQMAEKRQAQMSALKPMEDRISEKKASQAKASARQGKMNINQGMASNASAGVGHARGSAGQQEARAKSIAASRAKEAAIKTSQAKASGQQGKMNTSQGMASSATAGMRSAGGSAGQQAAKEKYYAEQAAKNASPANVAENGRALGRIKNRYSAPSTTSGDSAQFQTIGGRSPRAQYAGKRNGMSRYKYGGA